MSFISVPSKNKIMSQQLNLVTLTIHCMLLDSTYVESSAHEFRSDITGVEVSGTGYTASGIALTGKAINTVSTDVFWDFDDIVFNNVNLQGGNGVQYAAFVVIRGGAASADELIAVNTFASLLEPADEDLTLTVPTNGFLKY